MPQSVCARSPVLDWLAMRIGFVTQLLWERYGEFWRRLLSEAGARVMTPDRERTLALLGDDRVNAASGWSFRLAVAQALALVDADLLLVPDLNHGSESARGSGQDPWIADFPGVLARVGGLPPIRSVPAWLDPAQETTAVELLQRVLHESGSVRRILDRHRAALRPQPGRAAGVVGPSAEALLGQPWLLDDRTTRLLLPGSTRVAAQHRIDTSLLREEGRREDPRLVPTDQEVVGAARLFSRRGGIERLHLLIDDSSGSDRLLAERIERIVAKPLRIATVDELSDGADPGAVLFKAPDA